MSEAYMPTRQEWEQAQRENERLRQSEMTCAMHLRSALDREFVLVDENERLRELLAHERARAEAAEAERDTLRAAYRRGDRYRARALALVQLVRRFRSFAVEYHDEAFKLLAERDTLRAELGAVRFAAHMPADYAFGLPSWINQELYGQLIMLLDKDGRVIRRSEDVELMHTLRGLLSRAWAALEVRVPSDPLVDEIADALKEQVK